MKASIIIPLYKDLKSLKIVLNALERQTYKNFEIIIAEDDNSNNTINFLKDFSHLDIKHISQPDRGRNKIVIQNKAILKASGKYLFFIDGDIVPFKNFIEYSMQMAKPGRVLTGRRVNLDQKTTQMIKSDQLNTKDIESNYFSFLFQNRKNRNTRAEQGIQFNPKTLLYKMISKRKRNVEILGCNFSCFKDDIVSINGFDEGYGDSIIGQEDTDLTWRFKGIGCELYSSKNIANCFHLWHKENPNRNQKQDKIDLDIMKTKQKEKIYFCKNGLI